MAKLTRRKRRELNMKSQNQEMKHTVGEEKPTRNKSKKKHICIFHKDQELQDGTFICSICGHHLEKKMDETKLQDYFHNQNEYSLTELRDMDCHLLKVTYGRNTRGTVTEYETEELTGANAMRTVFELWEHFSFVNEDLTFTSDEVVDTSCKTSLSIAEDGSLLMEAMEDGSDMEMFQHYRWWCAKDDPGYNEKKWTFRTEQDKVVCYWVNPIYSDVYPINWELFYACIPDPVAVVKCVLDKDGSMEEQSIYLRNHETYRLKR